jgi:penicillin-binding protein 1C
VVTDRSGATVLAVVRTPGASLDVHSPGATGFVRYVSQELVRHGFRPGAQRLRVATTLDTGLQRLAQQVIDDRLQAEQWTDAGGQLGAALVSIVPGSGQIEVMASSPPSDGAPVHVGASLEPFIYAKALADGRITMETTIEDGPMPYVVRAPGTQPFEVKNLDGRSHGAQPARVSLANELSIPAARVELAAGIPATVDLFRRLGMLPRAVDSAGVVSANAPDTSYGPGLAFGDYPVTLLEEADAAAALADLGTFHQPEAILQVTDGAGHVLYRANPERTARQALDPGAAYIVNQMLSDNSNRQLMYGLSSALHLDGRRAAAVEGTSKDYSSTSTMGFTPDLATAVWVGDVLGPPHHLLNGIDGVFVAAPAWNRFMGGALLNVPADRWYAMPGDAVQQGGSYFLRSAPRVATLP